jgi:hypothetical protein
VVLHILTAAALSSPPIRRAFPDPLLASCGRSLFDIRSPGAALDIVTQYILGLDDLVGNLLFRSISGTARCARHNFSPLLCSTELPLQPK